MDWIDLERDLMPLVYGAAFFAELAVLVVVGKLSKGLMAGYKLDDELTEHDNPAVGISFAGYLGGLLLALSGVFFGPGTDSFVMDLVNVALWGLFAIATLNLSRILVDRVALAGFGNVEELVRDRNLGVGVCEAGGYLAAGLVVRMAVLGEGAWWLAPVYLVLGLALLLGASLLLRKVVFRRYELIAQIEADNVAAGILLGFHLLAIGWVIQDALGEMLLEAVVAEAPDAGALAVGLAYELGIGLLYVVIGIVGLTLLAALTDWLMLPRSNLRKEVVEDRSTGAALVAGTVAVFGAVILMTIF